MSSLHHSRLSTLLGRSARALAPPTEDEVRLRDALREEVARLPALTLTGSASEQAWTHNRQLLRSEIASRDPRFFLEWRVLRNTMVVSADAPYVAQAELPALRAAHWLPLLVEDPAGGPTILPGTSTSANLATHAYHVLRFRQLIGHNVTAYDQVFEFGAGYGSMCRLLYRLTAGRMQATLYDLPEFSALQRYFLGCVGVPAHLVTSTEGLHHREVGQRRLLVATWSLSETPTSVRDDVLTSIGEFDGYLIGFQETFGEVDNLAYFRAFAEERPGIRWTTESIAHLPGQHYLFGTSRH